MKYTFLIMTLCYSLLSFAGFLRSRQTINSDAPAYCELHDNEASQVVKIPMVPNYFFKTDPSGRYIYYTNSNMENYVFDTETNENRRIEGDSDGVPSFDGEIFTTLRRGNRTWTVGVANMENGLPSENIQFEESIAGSYQTVGTRQSNGQWPFVYFDDVSHEVKLRYLERDEQTNAPRFTTEERNFGTTLGQNLRLPMMSPDGTKISVLNTEINKTQIYDITSATPQLVTTLPFPTGKASFSYDSSNLTFHLNSFEQASMDEFNYPPGFNSDSEVRNVYVYNLSSGDYTQVTNSTNERSYFPIFIQNDKVAYIRNSNANEYSIEIVDVNNTKQVSLNNISCERRISLESDLQSLFDVWKGICTDLPGDTQGGENFSMLTLDPNNCRTMLAENNMNHLLGVCDSIEEAQHVNSVVRDSEPGSDLSGAQLLTQRCTMCHTNRDFFQENAAKAAEFIRQGVMPPGNPLEEDEKATLANYIQSLIE